MWQLQLYKKMCSLWKKIKQFKDILVQIIPNGFLVAVITIPLMLLSQEYCYQTQN